MVGRGWGEAMQFTVVAFHAFNPGISGSNLTGKIKQILTFSWNLSSNENPSAADGVAGTG